MIQREDLKALLEVGHALWGDPRECERVTVETLGAVALMELTPERALEKASRALLGRVRSRPAIGDWITQPFYRLEPEERFLLTALHLGDWSYARLAKIFEETPREIEEAAWAARIKMAANTQGVRYPSGARQAGSQCPEYDPKAPWTQRFLDEEISSGRERLFLQNHLMTCTSCRETLNRSRETYYALEARLPRLALDDPSSERMLRAMTGVSRTALGLRSPAQRTFIESLEIFVRRRDVRWALGGLAGLLVWGCSHLFF